MPDSRPIPPNGLFDGGKPNISMNQKDFFEAARLLARHQVPGSSNTWDACFALMRHCLFLSGYSQGIEVIDSLTADADAYKRHVAAAAQAVERTVKLTSDEAAAEISRWALEPMPGENLDETGASGGNTPAKEHADE